MKAFVVLVLHCSASASGPPLFWRGSPARRVVVSCAMPSLLCPERRRLASAVLFSRLRLRSSVYRGWTGRARRTGRRARETGRPLLA
jgi:hypothetical protein